MILSISYLDGMWSLAYFNKRNKELILSRDRFGEKPLYTFKNRKGIYFGSTIKYLFELSKSSKILIIIKLKITYHTALELLTLIMQVFLKILNK